MLQMKMSDGGRVVIPAEIRQSLGLKEGEMVLFEQRDGEVLITTKKARLERARAMFRKYVPPGGPSIADELIAERRAEAAQDEAEAAEATARRATHRP
jgi:AbrB family looped-hinge helix DNA binding protein